MLKVSYWGLGHWSWFWHSLWYLIQPRPKFWLSISILKMPRTSMSFKSTFGALEDPGGSRLGVGISILIWIWSLVFDIPMFRILAFYPDLKVQRTSMSFKSWFWSLKDARCSWLGLRILILICHLVCHYCRFLPLFATFCHFLPLLPPFATFWHFCHSCRFCHFLPFFATFCHFVGGPTTHTLRKYICVR